jgi:hypothetical protein
MTKFSILTQVYSVLNGAAIPVPHRTVPSQIAQSYLPATRIRRRWFVRHVDLEAGLSGRLSAA